MSSDDDFEVFPARKKKRTGQKKRKAVVDSDDDFEDDVPLAALRAKAKAKAPPAAPRPKPAAVAKPKKRPAPRAESSDSEDDVPLTMLRKQGAPMKIPKVVSVKSEKKAESAPRPSKSSSSSSSSGSTQRPKKKVKTERSASKKPSKKRGKGGTILEAHTKEVKRKTTVQLLDGARQAFKWWEVQPHKKKRNDAGELYEPKWSTLEHAGVHFSDAYTAHGVQVRARLCARRTRRPFRPSAPSAAARYRIAIALRSPTVRRPLHTRSVRARPRLAPLPLLVAARPPRAE
jgi:hypothetical protein